MLPMIKHTICSLIILCSLTLGACTPSMPHAACKKVCKDWHHDGKIVSSLNSCEKCVFQLGDRSAEMINGCALSLDAQA